MVMVGLCGCEGGVGLVVVVMVVGVGGGRRVSGLPTSFYGRWCSTTSFYGRPCSGAGRSSRGRGGWLGSESGLVCGAGCFLLASPQVVVPVEGGLGLGLGLGSGFGLG